MCFSNSYRSFSVGCVFAHIYKYIQLEYEFWCFNFSPLFFFLFFEPYHHIASTCLLTTGKKNKLLLRLSNKGLKCGEASKHISSMLGKSNMKLNCKTKKQPKEHSPEHGRLVCVFPQHRNTIFLCSRSRFYVPHWYWNEEGRFEERNSEWFDNFLTWFSLFPVKQTRWSTSQKKLTNYKKNSRANETCTHKIASVDWMRARADVKSSSTTAMALWIVITAMNEWIQSQSSGKTRAGMNGSNMKWKSHSESRKCLICHNLNRNIPLFHDSTSTNERTNDRVRGIKHYSQAHCSL